MERETLERLATLLPRLGSDFQGEAAATAAAIVRTLKRDGYDLHDLAAFIAGGKRQKTWVDTLEACIEGGFAGNELEQDFLETLARYADVEREPTEKQLKWLHDIYTRHERRSA